MNGRSNRNRPRCFDIHALRRSRLYYRQSGNPQGKSARKAEEKI
jgi:hypothetical protein